MNEFERKIMNKFETQKEILVSVMSSLEWDVSQIYVELDKEKIDSALIKKRLSGLVREMEQGVNYAFHEGLLFQSEEKKENKKMAKGQPGINDAKELSKKYGKDIVIIIHVSNEGQVGYASYGKGKQECNLAKFLANIAFDAINEGVSEIDEIS